MSDSQYVVDVTEQNVNDVLQGSMQTPVLLDFWAEWCEPCKTLAPVLQKLVGEYQGGFILAKVNADDQPMIAQQLGVRGLPTLKLVYQGQLVGELTGAQPESSIRQLLDQVAQPSEPVSSTEQLMAQVERARQMGAYDEAVDALMQALNDEPENNQYKAALANVMIDADRLDDAQSVVDQMGSDALEKKEPKARLFFRKKTEELPPKEQLTADLENKQNESQALYGLAVHDVVAGDLDGALERLMLLFQKDRNYGEDAARLALIDIFELLGADDPRTKKYRRKMFTLMH